MTMINIDFLTLRAFLIENIDFIIGSRIQKIQQPTRRDFILSLRNNNESRKFYINICPQIYHIAFMSKENEERRGIIIPQKPPMFCMLLRKYLEGARISDALTVENERILELHFESYDELSQKRLLCLAVELMGKHSNVILYDKESCIIIGCAHNVGPEKSRYRELQGGLKYVYPPGVGVNVGVNAGENSFPIPAEAGSESGQVCDNRLSNELKKQFAGLSQKKINHYLITETFTPAIKDNRYTLFEELIEGSIRQNSVNEMIDNYYSEIQQKINLKTVKNQLLEVAATRLKKTNNSINKISLLLKKRDNTDKYKLFGELITANLYQKCDYLKEIEVYDYINNKNIIIELDETKTLKENAQRYFKLYTKSKATKEKSEEMIRSLGIEKEYLENVLYSIECAKNIKELSDIKHELGIEVSKMTGQTKPVVEKVTIGGFDVYIGKNNKQNDFIVSKLAKDDDYWFHARLCAGSHVLLKTNGQNPTEDILFECCKLARKFSSASQPSKVGIIYTKAKNLRKPPAAPLGYVTYKNEKEVLI